MSRTTQVGAGLVVRADLVGGSVHAGETAMFDETLVGAEPHDPAVAQRRSDVDLIGVDPMGADPIGADTLAAESRFASEKSAAALFEAPAAACGDVVAGAFELLRRIGEGGMGTVWLGEDLTLGRHVAIKLMRIDGRTPAQRARLLRALELEARATARLHHPNVVTIHQVGSWRGSPYLVLELLDGESLDERLARGKLSLPEALHIMIHVLRALVHAHGAGLIHRDLKPQNVFLIAGGLTKVLDFGLAQVDVAAVTGGKLRADTNVIAGSPAYMAPEQWRGAAQDGRTDLWACGVMLYQLVTGHLPFQRPADVTGDAAAPLPRARVPALPVALDRVVARCLAKDPNQRYLDAMSLLRDLEDLCASQVSDDDLGVPFRYLRAFQEEEEAWFFGRQEEATQVIHELREGALTALVGASGAGKTSLINAAVLPRLRRKALPWSVLTVRPGRDPMAALIDCLEDVCSPSSLAMTGGDWRLDGGAVGRVLRAHGRESGGPVLLWVDHLEQLMAPEVDVASRDAFAAALLAAGDDAATPVRILVCVREEALPRFSACAKLHDAVVAHAVPLGRPSEAALASCVTEPLRRCGFTLDAGLLEQLMVGVHAQTSPLPLLQFAMSALWSQRDGTQKRLLGSALEALGGVDGILAAHAESVYASFVSEIDRAIVCRVVCALVSPDGRRIQRLRTVLEARSGAPANAAHVIERLVEGRLLTSSSGGTGHRLELSHDALTTGWPRLTEWLTDDVELRLFRRRLEQAARAWDEQGRAHGALWLGDAWRSERRLLARVRGDLSRVERDFVTCAAHVVQRARWKRRLLVASAVLVLLAISVGSYAMMLRFRVTAQDAQRAESAAQRNLRSARASQRRAQRQTTLAELARQRGVSNVLAMASQAVLARQPMSALRLARRAAQTRPTNQAISALHAALSASSERRVLTSGGPLTGARILLGGAVATFDDSGTVMFWPTDHSAPQTYVGRGDPIVATAVGRGDSLAVLHASGHVQLFDVNGRLRRTLVTSLHGSVGLAFDGTGERLAVINRAGAIEVWPANYAAVKSDSSEQQPFARYTLLQGSRAIVWFAGRWSVASDDGRIRRVDREGHVVGAFRGHGDAVLAMAVSKDGTALVSGSKDGTARLWRPGVASTIVARHAGWVTSVALSPNGQLIATGSADETAALWRLSGDRVARLTGHAYGVIRVRFCPRGIRVLTVSLDGTARIWTRDGTLHATLKGHRRPLVDGRWSQDGRTVVTASEDGTARLWRADPEELWTQIGPRCAIGAAAMSPDGTRVVTWSADDGFDPCVAQPPALWQVSSRLREPITGLPGVTVAAVLDNRGGVIALAEGMLVRVGLHGAIERTAVAHRGGLRELHRRVHDGDLLTRGANGSVALWSSGLAALWRRPVAAERARFCGRNAVLTAGAQFRYIDPAGLHDARQPAPPGVSAMACGAPEDPVVFGMNDGSVWLTDIHLARRRLLRGHTGRVTGLAVLDRGIASASRDGTARLWSASGEPLAVLRHDAPLVGLVAHDASDLLLTVPERGPMRLWGQDGRPRGELAHGDEELGSVAMSPDGKRLLVAQLDTDVRIRWLQADDLLRQAAARISADPSADTSQTSQLPSRSW